MKACKAVQGRAYVFTGELAHGNGAVGAAPAEVAVAAALVALPAAAAVVELAETRQQAGVAAHHLLIGALHRLCTPSHLSV